MFRKVLIANRGEIAVRIAQTLQQMGIIVMAVFSAVDRAALHVQAADEAWALERPVGHEPHALAAGKGVPTQPYLDGERIVALALERGADAIHPGYGFLSENADFARQCEEAGVCFIGPPSEVIRQMGDKIVSKRIMSEAGVPVVPGAQAAAVGGSEALRLAEEIGFPVLVKAAAGGGGKGMRVVESPADLDAALEASSREARHAFGDPTVFMEKYLTRPRHVEFQVLCDHHGNAVHLFERECSIQRRHQKIVEETPSPALDPELRLRMGAAALKAVRAVGYRNAGTVEFIVAPDGSFYFLEMNTRLQVEHPITEMTVGMDLVRAQVVVAAGHPLPFTQSDLRPRGHALECRIYAEDPTRGFLPCTGTIRRHRPPHGPWIRVDSGVMEGSVVSVHHDPMLAKLVTWGETRDEALARMRWALSRYVVLGVHTNIEFLQALMGHPSFREGDLHTHFLSEHTVAGRDEVAPEAEAWAAAGLAHHHLPRPHGSVPADGRSGETGKAVFPSPWDTVGAWRMDR